MRRIHHHHGESGRIGPCDCPNPAEPEPLYSRPPPTGYKGEHEAYHPGPGSRGYEAHAVACLPCLLALNKAIVRGEQWALAIRLAPTLATLGPGEGVMAVRRGHARRLRPQHIGPAAVAVGAASYAITALLAWWLSAPMLVGLLALLVYVGRRDMLELDRMPPARMLRR